MPEQPFTWWDAYSDQPYKLTSDVKSRLDPESLREHAALLGNAVLMFPLFLWRYATVKPAPVPPDPKTFIGLSVSPHPDYDDAIVEMVDELGVCELLVRVPTWDLQQLQTISHFMERFPQQRFLLNVLQDPTAVRDIGLWQSRLREVFSALEGKAEYFQIGNAVNRTKWGCHHPAEYLALLQAAEEVRAYYPGVRFVGSSVIDFEPLITFRTLYNRYRYQLDVVGALLYVNRRGSPYNRQFGVFDLAQKIRLLYALVSMGNRNAKRFWITEVNWPLLNTRPYTPNSGHPRSTVDEPTQARFLKEYYQIAYASGFVERVYWWQLINPGYGLVDHRGGSLRKHPAYFAFKETVQELGRVPEYKV